MRKEIICQINKSIDLKKLILSDNILIDNIQKSACIISDAYRLKNKTLLAGNGGSAGDAQHISGEFVGRFNFDRPSLPSIALTTNTSILTAIGNDYGFEKIFSRQLLAHGNAGDVFIGISTSGSSEDVVDAVKTSKELGVFSIGMTGESKCAMDDLCDLCIKVPSTDIPRIQEVHIMIGHIICHLVEDNLFGHLNPYK